MPDISADSCVDEIVEVKTAAQWEAACRLLRHQYPDRCAEEICNIVNIMRKREGWRAIGVFTATTDGADCIAFLFLHMGHRLYSGKFLRMDSMVVHPQYRGRRLGKRLMQRAEEIARKEKCQLIMLDSYVDNYDGHRFFHREGAFIRGYHMMKPLQENAIRGIPAAVNAESG